jgi:hypothetical protein
MESISWQHFHQAWPIITDVAKYLRYLRPIHFTLPWDGKFVDAYWPSVILYTQACYMRRYQW